MTLFECKEIRSGPVKLPGANSVMYVVNELRKSDYTNVVKGN